MSDSSTYVETRTWIANYTSDVYTRKAVRDFLVMDSLPSCVHYIRHRGGTQLWIDPSSYESLNEQRAINIEAALNRTQDLADLVPGLVTLLKDHKAMLAAAGVLGSVLVEGDQQIKDAEKLLQEYRP